MANCKVSGCKKEAKNRSMCWAHYSSNRRYGDPNFSSLEVRQKRRFFDSVEKTDSCWIWSGRRFMVGLKYGQVYFDKKTQSAHRVSWQIHNGKIPEGMCVLHHCDNPICVNPSHLYLGTHADNAKDRESRGRRKALRGSEIGNSKLNEESAYLIRNSDLSCTVLAKKHNVSRSLISLVKNNRVWSHIEDRP